MHKAANTKIQWQKDNPQCISGTEHYELCNSGAQDRLIRVKPFADVPFYTGQYDVHVACQSETCATLKHVSDLHCLPFWKKCDIWNKLQIGAMQTLLYWGETTTMLFLCSNPFNIRPHNTYQACFKNNPVSDVYVPIHCLHIVLLNFALSTQPLLTDPFPAIFEINYRNKCAGSKNIFNKLLKHHLFELEYNQ